MPLSGDEKLKIQSKLIILWEDLIEINKLV
jgi:hypothetical protein